MSAEWQPGETTASTGMIGKLTSTADNEDFGVCCDRRFFFFSSLFFFRMLQNYKSASLWLMWLRRFCSQTLKLSGILGYFLMCSVRCMVGLVTQEEKQQASGRG